MKNLLFFLLLIAMLFACENERTPTVQEIDPANELNDVGDCDVLIYSLDDDIGNGSFIKTKIKFQDSVQTIIVESVALFQIYGLSRFKSNEDYVMAVYEIIQAKSPLYVSRAEYQKLIHYRLVDTNIYEPNMSDTIIERYFENGKQRMDIQEEMAVINLLLESGFQVWREEYSGDLRIVNCEMILSE